MQLVYTYLAALFAGAMATPLSSSATSSNLHARDIDGDIICEGFDLAEKEQAKSGFDEGIDYLRQLTEDEKICGASAGECSRVSCSWDSAIYLCNNSDEDQNGVECKAVGDAAERVVKDCTERYYPHRNRVLGFQSNSEGLSVHLGKNSC